VPANTQRRVATEGQKHDKMIVNASPLDDFIKNTFFIAPTPLTHQGSL
jgi:hypothetical protein